MQMIKLHNPFRDWETIDYLASLVIGLVTASLAMLFSGHPWYCLYLALAALSPLTGIGLLFVVIAILYSDDDYS